MQQNKLLVIEDSRTIRLAMMSFLKKQGFQVTVAQNGCQGYELLCQQPFDLVLCDMIMPEMEGDELLQKIKSNPDLRHIPVVMLSGVEEMDSVVRCIEMGAEDYFQKTPFNPLLLNARINACLEKKRLQDQEKEYLRQIELQRQRADELLRVILPDSIVEELKATNTVKPRRIEHVAVLFSDIAGFTSYCDATAPEIVLPYLQELVEWFEDRSQLYGVQKIKTIGDCYMACAGFTRQTQTPVLDCVKCGLDMIAAASHSSAGWRIRVGVHAGPVIAGLVGNRQYLYDIYGDTVNTAARVESAGSVGKVNLSLSAWNEVSDYCIGHSLGETPIKGKGALEIFCVDRLRE